MSELITVIVILSLVVSAWFALFIDQHGVKEGVKLAVFVPAILITVLSVVIWVIYSFGKVFEGM